MAEPAGFTRAVDADSATRTAYNRPSCSRKRGHVLAIESMQAETRVRWVEKAPAMLRYRIAVRRAAPVTETSTNRTGDNCRAQPVTDPALRRRRRTSPPAPLGDN